MSKGARLAHLRRGVRQVKVGGARAERPGCVGIAGPLLWQRGQQEPCGRSSMLPQWEDMIRSWLPCSGKAIGGKGSCQEAGEEVTVVIQEGIP